MGDSPQGPRQQGTSTLPKLVNPWLTLIGGIFATLGSIWAAIEFFSPIADLDLTVVVEDKVEFSLPETASSLQKLALTYDGKPIKRISLVRLSIVNTGNRAIEPPRDSSTNEWILTLRSPKKNTPLVQVGELVRKPDYLYAVPVPGADSDAIHLKLRVLNRKESIVMQVALIGEGADSARLIRAETPEPRVRDLKVTVAQESVRNRIQNAFLGPLWVITLVVFFSWWIVDIRRGRVPVLAGPLSWKLALSGVLGVLILFFATGFLAAGASWLLAWIVQLVAFR